MKEKIHPKYYDDAKVTCSCGETFEIGATTPTIKVEVCSQCHPYFTGEHRIIDTAGQIERFNRRYKIKS